MEGDLLSSSGQVWSRSGPGLVQLKFNSLELDSELEIVKLLQLRTLSQCSVRTNFVNVFTRQKAFSLFICCVILIRDGDIKVDWDDGIFLFADDESLTCNVCDRSFETPRQLERHQIRKRHWG